MRHPWEFVDEAFRNPPLHARSVRAGMKPIFVFARKEP
jgi:hypothetical protein